MAPRTWRPAYKAIVGLGAGVWAWDMLCPAGETITAGVQSLRQQYPLAVTAAIAVTAAHLLGRLPQQADPFHWIGMVR